MNKSEYYHEDHTATYCPEDNKIRLYVGRVPRDQYDALRAEGWTSTPKQDCDFVATWTSSREDTALSFAGYIGDEDTPPTERAADRAERFSGYRDKRTTEATGHADNAETVHGFQYLEKAERAAKRAERQADRACTQWSKAEYWTSRTAGVIAHALHVSSPSVRMGRIKTLEAELRKAEKEWTEATQRAQARFDALQSIVDESEKVKITNGEILSNFRWELSKLREAEDIPKGEKAPFELVRRALVVAALGGWRESESNKARAKAAKEGTRPALEIAREWLEGKTRPEDWNPDKGSRYTRHLKLRLGYENQMLEAQGGRAAHAEMIPGGWLYGKQIEKVNKSPKTGRVVSVHVRVKTLGLDRWGNPDPKAPETRLEQIDTERLPADAYRAPTAEELAEFEAAQKAAKAAKPKAETLPTVNPTREEAERLQALVNARRKRSGYLDTEPKEVAELDQATYSANSKGAYAVCEMVTICAMAETPSGGWSNNARLHDARIGPALVKIRMWRDRVVILTDKPQKPLPAALWEPYQLPTDQTPAGLAPLAAEVVAAVYVTSRTPEQSKIVKSAWVAGLCNDHHLTEAGAQWARELGAFGTVTA